jgi:hypothetical protein
MTYKNVLVHCNNKRRLTRLLEPAAALCSDLGARLVGISVTPPIAVIPAGMPGTPDTIVVDAHCKAYRAENPPSKRRLAPATWQPNGGKTMPAVAASPRPSCGMRAPRVS